MKKSTVIIGIGAIAAIGGLIWFFKNKSTPQPIETTTAVLPDQPTTASQTQNTPTPPADLIKELMADTPYEPKITTPIRPPVLPLVRQLTPSRNSGREMLGLGYTLF